jgi:hypothetical protein
MSEGWVQFAYVVVYGFMVLYSLYLVARVRAVRRRAAGD